MAENKWVTAVITLLTRIRNQFITGRGPPCRLELRQPGGKCWRRGTWLWAVPCSILWGIEDLEWTTFVNIICGSHLIRLKKRDRKNSKLVVLEISWTTSSLFWGPKGILGKGRIPCFKPSILFRKIILKSVPSEPGQPFWEATMYKPKDPFGLVLRIQEFPEAILWHGDGIVTGILRAQGTWQQFW